jgi:hypothetical protein
VPLQVRNTQELLNRDRLRLKVLIYALPGWGKTKWAAGAPDPGFIACETGHGNGLLTIAQEGVDYVIPTTDDELETACGNQIFTNKATKVLDSATDAVVSLVKDAALAIPRRKGDSEKREAGVPELDDYGTMGELMRRHLTRLISFPGHIVVTAKLRIREPREGDTGPTIIGPDLPGQLMLGASGMFDLVLVGQIRQRLADPKNPKSRISERWLLTQPTGAYTAKSRLELAEPVYPPEVRVDYTTGEGTFKWFLDRAVAAYQANTTEG